MARRLAGRYELEVPLGRGASGEVWRSRDLTTRKPVAVKVVELAEIEDSALLAETIARFRREAATLARLRHPNIVAALEAGRIGNELFLVMELAEGISLASMLEQRMANNLGLFPVSSVLRIAEQACAGLAAAHSAGVVHRDIKPSNLMVATRVSIKIIDFGIARLLHDNSPRLTQPRQAIGTLAYISPEQLENIDVDGRADLYSLGCVIYEQLAGRPPFMAELPTALLQMHMEQRAVSLDAIRSDLPVGLARLVDRLMEKDRSKRPADAMQVLSYIAAISAGADGRARQEADRQTVVAGETLPRPAAPRAQPSFVPYAAPPPPPGRSSQRTESRIPILAPDPPRAEIPPRRSRWLAALRRLMRNG
ncbi:MAG TPA: serine/threonine-protein kinase [Trebonia sp.]|nr:serine/threonine-protein kinase [Trebonia sp.]